jgi:hypothetical protein
MFKSMKENDAYDSNFDNLKSETNDIKFNDFTVKRFSNNPD